MPRVRSFASTLVVYLLALGAFVAAQVQGVMPAQQRDPVVQQPTERAVPVGTSSISGTVVAADSGRPIAGARVTVSGTVPANVATPGAGRGGAAPARDGAIVVTPGMTRGGGPNQVMVSPSSLNRYVYTDSNGQFSFPRLPAGSFTIGISISGTQFLPTSYGQRRYNGPGRTIPLADGQQMTIKVPLIRPGVITGTVFGPDGEPQRNVQVRGFRYDTTSGFKRLQSNGYAQTDDRGVYRMHSLQPGDYFISATPNMSELANIERMAQESEAIERAIRSGQIRPPTTPGFTPTVAVPMPSGRGGEINFMQQPTYLQTYAPSSPTASGATRVTVAGGEEKTGIDVFVRLTQASSIQGSVMTPLDPAVQLQLTLISEDTTIDALQSMSTRTERDGKFYFRSIPPGKYIVVAQTVPGQPPVTYVNGQVVGPQPQPIVLTDAQKMWARVPVTVAGEPVIDVTVSLQPSRSISGMVVFDMQRQPDLTRSRYTVTLNPAPSPQQVFYQQMPADVGPDGRFTLKGVSPGRYTIRVNSGNLRSSLVNGQDTLDFPLEFTGERDVTDAVLTVTDSVSELAGTLLDSTGKPATDYMIVAASSDERYWGPGSRRIIVTRPNAEGRYIIRALPPGAYLVAVVMDLENGAQYDPEFLRSLPNAGVPVIIGEGAKMTQDLRVK